jgi:hypothetical protein
MICDAVITGLSQDRDCETECACGERRCDRDGRTCDPVCVNGDGCDYCDGRGSHEAHDLEEGRHECEQCRGDVRCAECYGTGRLRCHNPQSHPACQRAHPPEATVVEVQ